MTVSKLIEIIKLIAALYPAIVAFIAAVEEAIPDKGQGAAKLAMVRDLLAESFAALKLTAVAFDDVWPRIETLIATTVGLFNKVGRFAKG